VAAADRPRRLFEVAHQIAGVVVRRLNFDMIGSGIVGRAQLLRPEGQRAGHRPRQLVTVHLVMSRRTVAKSATG
jgi:hypothetical protein